MGTFLIGDISFGDMRFGKPLIELWSLQCYNTESKAEKALKKIKESLDENSSFKHSLCVIDDDKYNILENY